MKFARELEEDLVPEWRVKYLNYKQGKRKIKNLSRALHNINQTPKFGGRLRRGSESPKFTRYDYKSKRPASDSEPLRPEPARENYHPDASQQSPDANGDSPDSLTPFEDESKPQQVSRAGGREPHENSAWSKSLPMQLPGSQTLEKAQTRPEAAERGMTKYGSIIGSPPRQDSPSTMRALELPDPAMSNSNTRSRQPRGPWTIAGPQNIVAAPKPTDSTDAYHIGQTHVPHKQFSLPRHMFQSKRTLSTPDGNVTTSRPLVKRLFSAATPDSPKPIDMPLDISIYREFDQKQKEWFQYLDKELEKIESFYKMKEQEASHRLEVLREQLHEMRNRRMQEMMPETDHGNQQGLLAHLVPTTDENGDGRAAKFLKPIEGALRKTSPNHIGKTSRAMGELGSPKHPQPQMPEGQKDYTRRNTVNERVPYRTAKRKLKLALQEFYRGLELLKSYSLLNRTAFRKINKKYDKAVRARPTGRYMAEKVNEAHFVKSDTIEGHIVAVEDLYARYFERGNHKIAVTKLRKHSKRSGDYSGSTFRNGFCIAAGLTFGIQGIVSAAAYLLNGDPSVVTKTSYLLQLHAGYFLSLLLFLVFVLCCWVWTSAKINYVFIFEYDTRHNLDWRQLAELPCLFFFLNGLFLWLNFRTGTSDRMFLYWPVLLIGLTLLILALPLPIFYHRARKWWAFSNWRLLMAGLYPVEFRDFFLGDMYCSETYAMGNIELFFCLYSQHTPWSDPGQCNSTHSRLLGFFSTLPAIWRALQCLRRYYDSGSWMPHLANFAKYLGNILYYMTLSLYRINKTSELRALFIVFACFNATYCSFWDVAYDWSLGDPFARYPFLRENLAYRRVWPYYLAMVLDPILRFQWIFYAIYANDLQHSAIQSFFVALAEVARRGMWTLFRVENEHCNNVGSFRASRDIPLPYSLPSTPKESQEISAGERADAPATSVDVEQITPQTPGSSLRQRRTRTPMVSTPVETVMRRAGTFLGTAHAQDYERKKRPGVEGDGSSMTVMESHDNDDSEEDDDSDGQVSLFGGEDREEVMQVQKVLSRGQREH